MLALVLAVLTYWRAFSVGRHRLGLEFAALRQQLVVFKRKQPRPRLCSLDRAFWMALRGLWPGWVNALTIVKPDTVVSWHRAGFRLSCDYDPVLDGWAGQASARRFRS
jgi:hypothetical protein